MRKITRISFKLLDLLVIFMMVFGSPMSARAQVWTDPTDYPPGSIVTIRGDNSDADIDHNFLPGEAVHVDVLGPYGGYTLACDALADGNGAWACDVTLSSDPSLANGEYMFTATGQSSGNVETGTFTDAVVIGGFNIDGVVPDSGSLQFDDPFGNAAELGPLNQNTTKLGVINTDPLPTLGYTSITTGNDLTTAWLQTKVDPSTGHVWLYFAFARAAASTGVVAFEFEKNAAPVACNYAGVNLTDPPGATNTATQDLIANCNPFANRSPGDFLLVFDLQGQQLVIVKRTFLGNGLGFDSTNLDATVSAAAFSGSGNQTGLTGEGAVDLTATVFGTNPTSCFSVANIIPMTITGNSDTADFKDVVLGDFSGTGISSCGTVKVKKVTDPAGGTGSFPYTLSRTDSSALRYDGSTSVTGTLTSDGDIDTIADLKQGTNYTLAEGSVGPTWALVSISCTTDGTTYDVYPGSSAFNVKPSTITTCIITNKKQTGSLKLTKSLSGGPAGYTGPFTIHYDCGPGFINDVSVAAGSSQTVSGILTGTSCTVSEPTLPTPPPGYSFGTPTFSPSDTVTISAGTTVEVTTNNTLSRDTGSFKITKTTSNPDGATLPSAFTGTYDCGSGYTGTWSVANGGSQTVSGIPTGNTCSVTEDALTPISGYTWGTPTFTPTSIVISSKGGTFEIVVGNSISRDLGNFKITKTTSNPDGATLPAAFTGTYNCGTGYTGTWSVANGGSQTVSGIPTGNTCSVTEDALAPISGYTWGTPSFTPASIVISTKGGTFEIVVGNSITRDLGNFKITKTTSNPDGATLPTAFNGTYNCGAGYTGTWSVANGGSQTVTGIPTGNTCSVTEDALSPISGYTWGTPTFTPSSIVISSKGGTFEIVVGNSITRDRGSFKITKQTNNPDGATLPSAFTGTYNCGTGYTGNWNVADGGSQTVTGIPTGNTCSVTEDALTPISGYTWGTPTFTPPSIVISSKGGTFEIVVGNSITRDRGSFKITKQTNNPDGATLPTFTGTYNCGTGYTGTWSVANGGSQTVSGIPTGNTCSVTEDALTPISGYTWGTPTFTPTSIVISSKGGTFEIVVGNSITRDLGSLVLAKNLDDGGSGFTGPFTIHYDCGTFGSGDKSVSAGSSATVSDIPTGTSCTVSEPTLPSVTGYSFGTPTFSPSATVTIPAGNGSSITVTTNNTMTRDLGSLEIKKTLSNPDGASVPASFTVNYNCGTGYTGSRTVAPGSPATVSGIPTGNTCTVTEVAPAAIPGYTWGTITYTPSSVTIDTKGSTFTITVGNSITRDRGSLTIVKKVINDNGGTATVSAFGINTTAGSLTFDSGTANGTTTTYTSQKMTVVTGNYTLKENDVYGYSEGAWSCTGAAGTVVPTFNNGSVQVGKGEDVVCTITNNDQPGTIVVIKNAKPANGSFAFTTTTSDGNNSTLPAYAGFTLTGATTNNGNVNSQTLDAGTYTVKEGTQLNWILTGIGGAPEPNPYNCVVTGSGGSTGVGDLSTSTATITLKNGDTVTCTFENTGKGATRTQGFWATHSPLANIAWNGGTAFMHTFPGVAGTTGIGDKVLCGRTLGLNEVMGGFWSDISKTTTGKKRSALDQARMQLLQQLLAAELNASAFGSVPAGGTGQFAIWEAAYCGTNQTAIQNALQGAASFNNSGDSVTFTPGTSADSKNARAIANKVFWDTLP